MRSAFVIAFPDERPPRHMVSPEAVGDATGTAGHYTQKVTLHKLRRLFLFICLALPTEAQRRGPKPTGAPGSDLDILQAAVATFDGTLRSLDKKRLLIEMGEEQTVTIEVNKKTLYFRGKKAIPASAINPGAVVTVEAKKVANQLVAVTVRLREPPSEAR